MTGNRDANRGQCSQSCRWKYSLVESNRPGEYYPIEEDEHGTYILDVYKRQKMVYMVRKRSGQFVCSNKIVAFQWMVS